MCCYIVYLEYTHPKYNNKEKKHSEELKIFLVNFKQSQSRSGNVWTFLDTLK